MSKRDRPTVYLINAPTLSGSGRLPDLTPMAEYGTIKVLVENGEYPSFKPQECLRKIYQRLKDCDEERDYIAWAGGEPLSAVMVGAVLADLDKTSIRWLRFERGRNERGERDARCGHYNVVSVPIYDEDALETAKG